MQKWGMHNPNPQGLKIQTFEYHQNHRLNQTNPLQLISVVWVQKLRSYGQKPKILKIAVILKNGAINVKDMIFWAFFSISTIQVVVIVAIVKDQKSWHFGLKPPPPPRVWH